MSKTRSWNDLRSLRSERPGEAGRNSKRGETFVAALEQAEQLFAASGDVTPATSPILLYYGISQLGRALAAASPRLKNNEYILQGHGLSSPGESWSYNKVEEVTVKSKPPGRNPGAFQRVAQVVQSCAFEDGERRLDELIDLVAYIEDEPNIDMSLDSVSYPPLVLSPPASVTGGVPLTRGPQSMTVRLSGIPRSVLPKQAAARLDVLQDPDQVRPGHTGRDRLSSFLESYPTLRGGEPLTNDTDSIVEWRYLGPQHKLMQILISLPLEVNELSHPIPDRYNVKGLNMVLACTDGCGKADHPFTLWWALLFSLSMIARYAPREWRKMINVDTSAGAVRLEQTLEAAQISVPDFAAAVLHSMN